MDSAEVWRWIWLVVAAVFGFAETVTPVAFLFLPFAIGAGAASIAAFAGVSVGMEWVVFVLTTVLALAALLPVGRRLNRNVQQQRHAIGADRWVGRQAVVLAAIPAGHGETGLVRLDREQWRAESATGQPIPEGGNVLVTRVEGTRLVVLPLD